MAGPRGASHRGTGLGIGGGAMSVAGDRWRRWRRSARSVGPAMKMVSPIWRSSTDDRTEPTRDQKALARSFRSSLPVFIDGTLHGLDGHA